LSKINKFWRRVEGCEMPTPSPFLVFEDIADILIQPFPPKFNALSLKGCKP
jgi:hypothetical protein